jgi:hypothetical protein
MRTLKYNRFSGSCKTNRNCHKSIEHLTFVVVFVCNDIHYNNHLNKYKCTRMKIKHVDSDIKCVFSILKIFLICMSLAN